ncbi:MAG: hypothetical protein AB8D52_08815 [Gammaproteobacteria bacterium]
MPAPLDTEILLVVLGASTCVVLTVIAILQRQSESKRQSRHNLKPK